MGEFSSRIPLLLVILFILLAPKLLAAPAPTRIAPAPIALSGWTDNLDADNTARWYKADGWEIGSANCSLRADHISFSGGIMTLQLTDTETNNFPYGCSQYQTLNKYQYGKINVRLKTPPLVSGVVVGIFTFSDDPGVQDEIDIELGGFDGGPVQFNYYKNGTAGHEKWITPDFDPSAAFHEYTIWWRPNSIAWYIDGQLVHSVTGNSTTLPAKPEKIVINIWTGDETLQGWMGELNYAGPLSVEVDRIIFEKYNPLIAPSPMTIQR